MDAMSSFERQLTTLHPDFVMWQYKIHPCPNPHGHTAEDCVWAHPEDHHRRRSPHLYTAEYCKFMRSKHVCCVGDACPKAHTLLEYRLHPSRFRTERCRYGTRAQCPNAVCFFAHTDAELRAAPAPAPGPTLMGLCGTVAATTAPSGLGWCASEALAQGQAPLGAGGFAPALQQHQHQHQQLLLQQQFPQLGLAPQQQGPQQQQYASMAGGNMVMLTPSAALQMHQGGQGLLMANNSVPMGATAAHQFACLPADAASAGMGGGGGGMPMLLPQLAPPQPFVHGGDGSGQVMLVMGSQAPSCWAAGSSLTGGSATPLAVAQQQPYQQHPLHLAPGVSLAQAVASGPQLLQGPFSTALQPGAPLPLQQPQVLIREAQPDGTGMVGMEAFAGVGPKEGLLGKLQQQQQRGQQQVVGLELGAPRPGLAHANHTTTTSSSPGAGGFLGSGTLFPEHTQQGCALPDAGVAWGAHPAHLAGLAASALEGAAPGSRGELEGALVASQVTGLGSAGAGGREGNVCSGSPGKLGSLAPGGERLGDVLQMMLAHFKPLELCSLHASLGQSLQQYRLVA